MQIELQTSKKELFLKCSEYYTMPKTMNSVSRLELELITVGEGIFYMPSKKQKQAKRKSVPGFTNLQLNFIVNFLLLNKFGKLLPFEQSQDGRFYTNILHNEFPGTYEKLCQQYQFSTTVPMKTNFIRPANGLHQYGKGKTEAQRFYISEGIAKVLADIKKFDKSEQINGQINQFDKLNHELGTRLSILYQRCFCQFFTYYDKAQQQMTKLLKQNKIAYNKYQVFLSSKVGLQKYKYFQEIIGERIFLNDTKMPIEELNPNDFRVETIIPEELRQYTMYTMDEMFDIIEAKNLSGVTQLICGNRNQNYEDIRRQVWGHVVTPLAGFGWFTMNYNQKLSEETIQGINSSPTQFSATLLFDGLKQYDNELSHQNKQLVNAFKNAFAYGMSYSRDTDAFIMAVFDVYFSNRSLTDILLQLDYCTFTQFAYSAIVKSKKANNLRSYYLMVYLEGMLDSTIWAKSMKIRKFLIDNLNFIDPTKFVFSLETEINLRRCILSACVSKVQMSQFKTKLLAVTSLSSRTFMRFIPTFSKLFYSDNRNQNVLFLNLMAVVDTQAGSLLRYVDTYGKDIVSQYSFFQECNEKVIEKIKELGFKQDFFIHFLKTAEKVSNFWRYELLKFNILGKVVEKEFVAYSALYGYMQTLHYLYNNCDNTLAIVNAIHNGDWNTAQNAYSLMGKIINMIVTTLPDTPELTQEDVDRFCNDGALLLVCAYIKKFKFQFFGEDDCSFASFLEKNGATRVFTRGQNIINVTDSPLKRSFI